MLFFPVIWKIDWYRWMKIPNLQKKGDAIFAVRKRIGKRIAILQYKWYNKDGKTFAVLLNFFLFFIVFEFTRFFIEISNNC